MDQVRKRLNEIRQKQLEMQQGIQKEQPAGPASDKSQLLVALAGMAAGLTIAAVVWLAKSLLTADEPGIPTQESSLPILSDDIRTMNSHIDQLNKRIYSLTESISAMELELTRVMELSRSSAGDRKMLPISSRQENAGTGDEEPAFAVPGHHAVGISGSIATAEQAFVPTHTVIARLNLRSSTSLETTPIAVLEFGTKVKFISETDGWYYVNTEKYGKGWCASDYLAPIRPAQQ